MWLWPGQPLSITTPAYQSTLCHSLLSLRDDWSWDHRWRSERGPIWSPDTSIGILPHRHHLRHCGCKMVKWVELWEKLVVFQCFYNTGRKHKSIHLKGSIFCNLLIILKSVGAGCCPSRCTPTLSSRVSELWEYFYYHYYFPSGLSLCGSLSI